MILYNSFLRLVRLPLSVALIIFSGFTASAKITAVSKSQATPPRAVASSEVILNLSDFGAAGDGVANDGPALQAALDALGNAGGGTLLIPAGSYLISTPVVKDFSEVEAADIKIQGIPSTTMPAPPTADGQSLGAGLDLTSELIPATGDQHTALTLSGIHKFLIEHVGFTGRDVMTDAYITLYLSDIDQATVRHCEFYGLSTFELEAGFGGGNLIRAVRSELSIESTVFLGCTANSGANAPIVENVEWRKFTISNSIFLDYGLRTFFGKMGLGAPLAWINIANAAATTPESPRREVIVRDTFFDEGGWVGMSVNPRLWDPPTAPVDLIYISGLKMNVSNLGTSGLFLHDSRNLLVENSHFGWSQATIAAIDVHGFEHAILDRLTCIDDADRIRADDRTGRLTVINSVYEGIDSQAETTTEMNTPPDKDPVQYVRQRFVSVLGRQPDPAAHFYWSDVLIKCGDNAECLTQQQSALNEFLTSNPQTDFSITGTVKDENGNPLSGAAINLTGSQSAAALTDSQGTFRFSNLPTSGSYSVTAGKKHYTFTTTTQTFLRPAGNVTAAFSATLNRHTIAGRIFKANHVGLSGVTVRLSGSSTSTVTTEADGSYSFSGLVAGGNYTIVPSQNDRVFTGITTFNDLSSDRTANFVGQLRPELLLLNRSEIAVALDSVSFASRPFSIFDVLGFGDDGLARVLVFAKNVESFVQVSHISAGAEDDEGKTFPLQVEFIGPVVGESSLKQLNLKLSPELESGKCYEIRLSVAGIASNGGRICLSVVNP